MPLQVEQIPGRYKALDVSGQALAFASTGVGFRIAGVSPAEDFVLLDTGLDFAISDGMTGGVSYAGPFGDAVTSNAVKGQLTRLFWNASTSALGH